MTYHRGVSSLYPVPVYDQHQNTELRMEQITLKISGMSCDHCVGAVKRALQDLNSVRVEDVAIGSATVAYDPTAVTSADIVDAVQDAGYEAGAMPGSGSGE